MTYSEKLKDPRWQKKRLKVLQRDKFSCQYCYDKETTLHVHHMVYKNNPWDVSLNNLITLCKNCHSLVESCKKHEFNIELPIIKRFIGNDKIVYFVRDKDNYTKIFIQNEHFYNPLPIGIPYSLISELNCLFNKDIF